MRSARQANRRYFRQAYRSGQHGWGVQEPSSRAVGFLRRLRRLLPGARLLDVGCGEGRHAIVGAKMGFKVTAVDYESLALRRARTFAKAAAVRGIRFCRGDVLHLPFGRDRFDVVLDYGCLHHQRKADWPAYLANILRVLEPRGFLVLSVFSPRFYLFGGSHGLGTSLRERIGDASGGRTSWTCSARRLRSWSWWKSGTAKAASGTCL